MATYWENSCSFGLRYVSWYKYLIVSCCFFPTSVFWSGNLLLIAPFPDLCLLVPFYVNRRARKAYSEYRIAYSEYRIAYTVYLRLRSHRSRLFGYTVYVFEGTRILEIKHYDFLIPGHIGEHY